MATSPQEQFHSFKEYIAIDARSDTKYEFCQGQMFPMTGASRAPNRSRKRLRSDP
jgi:hypothetical protein